MHDSGNPPCCDGNELFFHPRPKVHLTSVEEQQDSSLCRGWSSSCGSLWVQGLQTIGWRSQVGKDDQQYFGGARVGGGISSFWMRLSGRMWIWAQCVGKWEVNQRSERGTSCGVGPRYSVGDSRGRRGLMYKRNVGVLSWYMLTVIVVLSKLMACEVLAFHNMFIKSYFCGGFSRGVSVGEFGRIEQVVVEQQRLLSVHKTRLSESNGNGDKRGDGDASNGESPSADDGEGFSDEREEMEMGEPILLEDLDWRVAKIRLEEENLKRILKSRPRFLPYEEARRWVQAWGGRWQSEKDWKDWIAEGEKRNSYIPARPDEYYGRIGKWISWEHFLLEEEKDEE